MPYLNNIPQADHTLANDQELILDNFYEINEFLGVDHYQLTDLDPTRVGKHATAQFTPLAAKPNTIATTVAIYNRVSDITQREELTFAPASNADPYEFTSHVIDQFGFTRLPSGLAFKWGFGGVGANGTVDINLNRAEMPNFEIAFSVSVTPYSDDSVDVDGSLGINAAYNTGFRVYNSYAVDMNFYYLVTGR